jgi:hypothetical protein
MVEARRASLIFSLPLGLLSLAVGCGEGPPLDELPLRDSLRAEPAVVAALPPAARAQLAGRLEAARTGDSGSDPVVTTTGAGNLVGALDEARARRSADALIVGAIADGVGRPVAAVAPPADQQPLPPLEGPVATDTAAMEARALAGAAGAPLRGLLANSGASRLERVIGWPVGAVAIGDTLYVDASWLVALAPADGEADGGARDAEPARVGASTTASTAAATVATAVPYPVGGNPFGGSQYDAGTYTPPPPPPPPPPPSSSSGFWDACAASSDSCDTSSDDSSCSSTDDGTDSSCSGSTDDGSSADCSAPPPDDGSSCRVAPGRERSRPSTLVWVMAPLGFLIGRRR